MSEHDACERVLNSLVDYFYVKNPSCMGGKSDNKENVLNWAHPFSRAWGHRRGSDVTKGDIMEVRVYRITSRL